MRRIIALHPDVPFWLCVGDIADDAGRYEPVGAPVYFVHGNNDNFDVIAANELPGDFHYIPNGTSVRPEGLTHTGRASGPSSADQDFTPASVGQGSSAGSVGQSFSPDLRVAALGGTFAPTWYETRASALPHPRKASRRATELADKRRHFVREQVEACEQLTGVDILLTHEAPKPFRPFPGGRGPDAGKVQINAVLRAMQPRLHLFGHHHRVSEQIVDGVRSIGLDLVTRSYLLIDPESIQVELVTP